MKNCFIIIGILSVLCIASCRKDFDTVPSFGDLRFSKDTVFLDTIFSNISSSTYRFKVYNTSNQDIHIPSIGLEKGNSSFYRLNVDGAPGTFFEDVTLLANDSMYVFVETTIDRAAVTDPLYTDRILFDNGEKQQDVDLVTLVQDAVFIFPNKDPFTMKIDSLTLDGKPTSIKGRFLSDSELTFSNEKPYVIYGYCAVPENKTLTIEAGAKLYFHDQSGLIVDRKASLHIDGTPGNEVQIEGDRLEYAFDDIPGQWGTIWMRAGSQNNRIRNTTIRNGMIGILVDSIGNNSHPTLKLENTQLYNHSNYGILGRETHIEGQNVVIGNCGQSSLVCSIGGNYTFTHSTFANYWSKSLRQLPAVVVNNYYSYIDDNNQEITVPRPLHNATFTNCIIDGANQIELIFDKVEGADFNFLVQHSMVQFNDVNNTFENSTTMNFEDISHYLEIIRNGDSHFKNPGASEFMIGQLNEGIGKGLSSGAQMVPLDILGVDRTSAPDIGAYQHINFE